MKRRELFVSLFAVGGLSASCVDRPGRPAQATAPSQANESETWVPAPAAADQLHRLEEMNTEQLSARWVFLVNHHGSPYHLHALDEAADYFNDTYGGHMVNLASVRGLDELSAIFDQLTSEAERNEDASSGHAGMRETSEALYLRPDLVNPAYKQAPVLAARTFEELVQIARRNDWPGYLGSPRLASASLGERALKEYSGRLNTIALEILDGRDYRQMTRVADEAVRTKDPIADSISRHERAFEQRQAEWLQRHNRGTEHAIR